MHLEVVNIRASRGPSNSLHKLTIVHQTHIREICQDGQPFREHLGVGKSTQIAQLADGSQRLLCLPILQMLTPIFEEPSAGSIRDVIALVDTNGEGGESGCLAGLGWVNETGVLPDALHGESWC